MPAQLTNAPARKVRWRRFRLAIVALAAALSLIGTVSPAAASGTFYGTWYSSYGYGYVAYGDTCDGVGAVNFSNSWLPVFVYGYRSGSSTWVSYIIFRNYTAYSIGYNNGLTLRGTYGDSYWVPMPGPIPPSGSARVNVYRTFSGTRLTMHIYPYVTQFYYGACGLTSLQL